MVGGSRTRMEAQAGQLLSALVGQARKSRYSPSKADISPSPALLPAANPADAAAESGHVPARGRAGRPLTRCAPLHGFGLRRVSEALMLTADRARVDLAAGVLVFETLKK